MKIEIKDIVAAIVALDRADRFISSGRSADRASIVEGGQISDACWNAQLTLKRAIGFEKIEIAEVFHV